MPRPKDKSGRWSARTAERHDSSGRAPLAARQRGAVLRFRRSPDGHARRPRSIGPRRTTTGCMPLVTLAIQHRRQAAGVAPGRRCERRGRAAARRPSGQSDTRSTTEPPWRCDSEARCRDSTAHPTLTPGSLGRPAAAHHDRLHALRHAAAGWRTIVKSSRARPRSWHRRFSAHDRAADGRPRAAGDVPVGRASANRLPGRSGRAATAQQLNSD